MICRHCRRRKERLYFLRKKSENKRTKKDKTPCEFRGRERRRDRSPSGRLLCAGRDAAAAPLVSPSPSKKNLCSEPKKTGRGTENCKSWFFASFRTARKKEFVEASMESKRRNDARKKVGNGFPGKTFGKSRPRVFPVTEHNTHHPFARKEPQTTSPLELPCRLPPPCHRATRAWPLFRTEELRSITPKSRLSCALLGRQKNS